MRVLSYWIYHLPKSITRLEAFYLCAYILRFKSIPPFTIAITVIDSTNARVLGVSTRGDAHPYLVLRHKPPIKLKTHSTWLFISPFLSSSAPSIHAYAKTSSAKHQTTPSDAHSSLPPACGRPLPQQPSIAFSSS